MKLRRLLLSGSLALAWAGQTAASTADASAAVGSPRTVVCLNEGWKTWLLSAVSYDGVPVDTLRVDLPHNWDDYYGYRQLTHGHLHGSAAYVKRFTAAPLRPGQRAFLRFEGVGSYAAVRLNGHDFGRHAGGRVSFTLDVTEAFLTDNLLEVTAEHPQLISDLPCVCGGCSSEWGFSEGSQPLGIFRPVTLEITDEVRIEPFGVHVWNNDAADTLFIETEVKNYGTDARRLVLTQSCEGLTDTPLTADALVAPGETRLFRQVLPLCEPLRWSHDDPFLYHLETALSGDAADAVSTRFGIRTLSWPVHRGDGDGRFFINGEPFFLNGTCEYEHLLGGGHAFSDEQIRARVKGICRAGFNAFRDAHQPHNLRYQELWEDNGILLWTQFSAHIWYDTPEFRENFKAQLRQWVKERRNSPAVVLWGLQNESVLPEAFARECCDIIRELDPTALTQRAITTCNGGTGTDWNVVQNWSGTYSGNLFAYDQELARPSQLLNGEYGAWRTLDLHQEPAAFEEKGAYTEERFTQLLETKVRLAEQARDSVCGQFQWCYTSHDNPGRRQPEEAWRLIDRVGPVNYKGLLTPWDEPLDAWYMYQANYTDPDETPMVRLAAHNWSDRFASQVTGDTLTGDLRGCDPRRYELRHVTFEAFSNGDSVMLFNDRVWPEQPATTASPAWLGTTVNSGVKGTHFVFPDCRISTGIVQAVAFRNGQAVAADLVRFKHLPAAPLFARHQKLQAKTDPLRPTRRQHYLYRLNCGGDAFTDSHGQTWLQDNLTYSRSWGSDFAGVNPYQASQRVTPDPIESTVNEALFNHFRYGRQRLSFTFPLPDGRYRLELYFIEPWYHDEGLRIFDVAVNGQTRLHRLDIWKEAGHDRALKKVIDSVEVSGGRLVIDFPKVWAGQAVISAIAVSTDDKAVFRRFRQQGLPRFQVTKLDSGAAFARTYVEEWSWAAADTAGAAKLPASMLPEDTDGRRSVNYPATEAVLSGPYARSVERKKACVVFPDSTASTPASVTWTFQTGLAQIYALRFNYRNLSGRSLKLRMRLLASDGRLLKEAELTFDPNDRGWKALNTTTGTYINAGTYRLELSAPDLSGLQLESLDVQ